MTIYFIDGTSVFEWQDITTLWEAILPNWEDMLETQSNYKIFQNSSTYDWPVWKLQLVSNFSNKPIQLDSQVLEWDMTLLVNNDRYSEWKITPNLDLEAQLDMQGFWQFTILGGSSTETLVPVATGLTKVVNDSDLQLDNRPKYTGPNPDAESYIIYS